MPPPRAAAEETATAHPRRRGGTVVRLLTAAWTASGVVLWLLFPMTAPVLLTLCAIAPTAWYWHARGRLPWHVPSLATVVLVLAGVYLLVNASWSLGLPTALRAIALVVVMAGVLHIVLPTLPQLDAAPLRAMAAGTLAGLAAGGALLCFEIFSEQALRRFAMELVPALQPYPHHLEMDGDRIARLMPYLPNASIGVLGLLLWPGVLIACRLDLAHRRRWGVSAAGAALAATVLASEHDTSKVALVGAAAAFAIWRARPAVARRLVVAGWVAATTLVVPVTSLLYAVDVHRAAWLPDSARHRVVIWGVTSTEVAKAPLLGVGVGTVGALHEDRDPDGPRAPGTRYRLGTGLHSHNAYLQVWYETGAAGALVLLGLGLVVLRALTRFSADVQPGLAATFVAGALLAASSYSAWASWLMASLAMGCIFAVLGAALPRGGGAAHDGGR